MGAWSSSGDPVRTRTALHLSCPLRPPPKIAFPLFCAPLLSVFGYRAPLAAANQDHWRHRILPLIISANAFVPRSISVSLWLGLFNFILASAILSDKITLARGRGSQLEDEDGNGIIPLNDCLNVRPRGAACLSPLGRSVLVTLPPAARRPPRGSSAISTPLFCPQ